ncbi:MAG: cytochrome c, partial [Verrucomicrobiota bacterium]
MKLWCLLFFSLVFASVVRAEPTFNDEIATMIHQNCSTCHRPGESAPFSLLTYDEVSKKARTIQRAIEDGYMPPWHADDSQAYMGVRRLSQEQIDRFSDWVDAGKSEGDPDKAPSMPEFPEGWQLGEPDLVVTMAKGYTVPAEGADIYRNFVIPLDLPEDKWVKAVELRPSARSVVHHSLFFLYDSGTARKLDGKDGKPGFRNMAFRRSGALGGYVPGSTPRKLPQDFALPLPQGSDLVLSTHFHPSGKEEMEQTTVGFFFADKPPARKVETVQVPPAFGRTAGIDIPAGESDFKIERTFEIPVDIEAIKISGHAHYICDSMKMTATLPGGEVQTLLNIPEWDLDWQDDYFFKEKLILPAGTVLK